MSVRHYCVICAGEKEGNRDYSRVQVHCAGAEFCCQVKVLSEMIKIVIEDRAACPWKIGSNQDKEMWKIGLFGC